MTLVVQVEALTYMVILIMFFPVEVHGTNDVQYFIQSFTNKMNILGMFQTCCSLNSLFFFFIIVQFNLQKYFNQHSRRIISFNNPLK